MFGVWRLILAIFVVVYHMGKVPLIGPFAVYGFFTLSGFLMTLIMHESYGYSLSGLKRFSVNRFLRLYPMYWAVIFSTFILIFYIGSEYSSSYCLPLQLPDSIPEILTNVLMIFPSFVPTDWEVILAPPSWALTIELFFYACIAFGLSRTRLLTWFWLLLSVIYLVTTYLYGFQRYSSIFAGSLPFSLGAIAYHYRHEIIIICDKFHLSNPFFCLLLYTVNSFTFAFDRMLNENNILIGGFYTNLLLSMYVCVVLYYRGSSMISKRWDTFLGDFSYPIYLMHWQVGLGVSYFIFQSPIGASENARWPILIFSLLLIFPISYLFIRLIDKNIDSVRRRIRENNLL